MQQDDTKITSDALKEDSGFKDSLKGEQLWPPLRFHIECAGLDGLEGDVMPVPITILP